ncbi:MAG: hypothetical protein ACREQY_06740 [Candidatus Binatia bacterium]
MTDIAQLVYRYAGVWNEPDCEVRRRTIASLWSEEGATLRRTAKNSARGHQAIEARVASAHEKSVSIGSNVFRSRNTVDAQLDVVKFGWEMVLDGGSEAAASGSRSSSWTTDGRIRTD